MEQDEIYVGWIDGDPEDFLLLSALGVKGVMRYRDYAYRPTMVRKQKMFGLLWKTIEVGPTHLEVTGKHGTFEDCHVKKGDMEFIQKNYPLFNHEVFSPLKKG